MTAHMRCTTERNREAKPSFVPNRFFNFKGLRSELHLAIHYAEVHLSGDRYQACKDSGDRKIVPMIKMDAKTYKKFEETGLSATLEFTTSSITPEIFNIYNLHACKVRG
jgi:hypothetical protein